MPFMFMVVLLVAVIALILWSRGRRGDVEALPLLRRLAIAFAALLLVFLSTSCITVVRAGNVGVVDVFGRVSDTTLKAGLQLVNPLARVVQMSVQTQEIKETMDVPSKEGMTMGIEVSVLFHLDPDKAADVYRRVGLDYVGVILEPQFRSITRGVTASYEAKALYTSEREAVAQLITDDLKKAVEPRGDIRADQGEAGSRAEAHRSARHRRLPADCDQRHQRSAAAVEGHRSHAGSGEERERQGRDHRQRQERPAAGAGRREVGGALQPAASRSLLPFAGFC
jgi:hypothetical protein